MIKLGVHQRFATAMRAASRVQAQATKPRCLLCGSLRKVGCYNYDGIDVLTVNQHHVASKHEGPTITLCVRCHSRITAGEMDRRETMTQELTIRFLHGIVDLIVAFIDLLEKTGGNENG